MAATLNSNIVKGSDLMIFVKDSSNAAGKVIGFATSCELSMSADATETSNKDSGNGWATSAVTKRSWTMSSENMYAETVYTGEKTFANLFDAYANGTELTLVWSPTQNVGAATRTPEVSDTSAGWVSTGTTYSGVGIVTSLSATASNDDNATFSVEFTGVGPISKS